MSTIQCKEHLTTVELTGQFGMVERIDDLFTQYRLRWLGHVARMPGTRHPKMLLFGWLPQKCPAHGAKLVGETRSIRIRSASHHGMQKHRILPDGEQFVLMILISM